MYSYAKVCRSLYEASSNKEYVGRFKAESMEYFELITEIHPRFAQAYYYLGYAYLNMGLYAKAQAAWKGFLRWSQNPKDTREIKGRIKQIADPVRIEEGYTDIMARRYSDGIDILEPYLSTQFKDWWPLHYYLGIAYDRLGRRGEAVARFKQTLALNGSHLETMEELTRIYREEGDKENAVKYENKIRLIRTELEKERRELERLMAAEDLMSETDGLAAEEAGIPAEAPKKAPAKTPEKEAKKVKRLK
jgi:tetratricopeptide (TPR) repeat protein